MNSIQILGVIIMLMIGAYLCGFWMACVMCEKRIIAMKERFVKMNAIVRAEMLNSVGRWE